MCARALLLLFLAGCVEPTGAADGGGLTDARTPDTGAPFVAVVGSRCRASERLGGVEVVDEGGSRSLSAWLQDRPDPEIGEPELSDSSCEFHRAWSGACDCPGSLVCSPTGSCVPYPVPAPDLAVTVRGTSSSQRLEARPSGSLWGDVTVNDPTVQLTITAGGLRVEVPPMSAPPRLVWLSELKGSESDPQAMDVTWTAPADAAHVHSLTRINHHAGHLPTFTECVVEASAGALHIDGAMLKPLAVFTGLEFQRIHHMRLAAVDVPGGCVEVRFERR